ncbi:MAG: FAD-dependent oxidoreductase, partial [Desulfuromonadales bacterium]|nr:FAD-dependent oxidoreductase [Desulfuromonadales bacterium]
IKENSLLPAVCGRVCPQEVQCQQTCTVGKKFKDVDKAVSIGRLERFVADWDKNNETIPQVAPPTGKKIAVIGAGPAGMAAAQQLARAGHEVHLYEKNQKIGGLMRYGIPDFKMEKTLIDRRAEQMGAEGVTFHYGIDVGKDISFTELTDRHDAVILSGGAENPRDLPIEGRQLNGVHFAMDFLTQQNRRVSNEPILNTEPILAGGKHVVVIGGGDTAMDCLRTAVRDGARSVSCLYRRDAANMPGSRKEYHNAVEEGVEFCFNTSPRNIHRKETGVLCVEVEKTRMGEPGEDGRQRVEILPDSVHCVPADVVIPALGFDMETLPGLLAAKVECDQWGQLMIDPATGATSNPKVYAGGDCYRGADLVVTAAADGRRAALAIMRKLLTR